jgi:Protein of unknown function (DUF3703)
MKFNWNMPKGLERHYQSELSQYAGELRAGHLQQAWRHLERAHILGQAYPKEHTYVHWKMLQFGLQIKSRKEVVGQIPRLLVGGVKSFVGRIPVGNTGGANVPPLQPMEIPGDLREVLEQNRD